MLSLVAHLVSYWHITFFSPVYAFHTDYILYGHDDDRKLDTFLGVDYKNLKIS